MVTMREWIKKLLITLFRMLPLREDIIMESHPDFSDNTYALYQYMLEQGVNRRHRIHWAIYDKEKKIPELPENVDTFYLDASGFSQMWKRFAALYRSRYIFDCNAYIHKRRKGQVRIHLGHGMLIKITPKYHNAQKIGECDGYLVTSPFWYDTFVEKIGLKKEVLLPFGYPRNDVLVEGCRKENRLGRYLMWMPTYRQHRLRLEEGLTARYPYGMPEVMNREQLLELEALLAKEGMILYFRPHPVQELSLIEKENLEHIRIADDTFLQKEDLTLYEMLASAEALLTDYSSVYYDFLLTERPIGLTIGDRDEYFRQYDCPFDDLKENVKGIFIESFDELMDFVSQVAALPRSAQEDIPQKEVLREMKKRYHKYPDGSASERLYHFLKKKYKFDNAE